MTSFSVRVPFAGEAVSVFKTVSDLFTYGDFAPEKITRINDDTTSFSYPVTLGVFRLLLDGQCVLVDRDYDNQVSLMTMTSRDRGGKGKLDGTIRLSLNDTASQHFVECDCDVTAKGMLARVELPIESVLSSKIENVLTRIISDSQKTIHIDDFVVSPDMDNIAYDVFSTGDSVQAPQVDALSSLVQSGTIRISESMSEQTHKPVWVLVLQFPARVVLAPLMLLRHFLMPLF